MSIQVKIPGKAKGYFSVRTLKNGEVTQEIKDTNNIITDAGLAVLLNSTPLYLYDHMRVGVGSGNDEILGNFTDLPSNLGIYSSVSGGTSTSFSSLGITFIDNGDNTCTIRRSTVYSFNIGQFSNTTISSIGLWRAASNGTRYELLAGQLIKNEFDTPTTVTIANDEQLQVTYTLEVTVSLVTLPVATGTVDGHGTPVGFTIYVHPIITKWPTLPSDSGWTTNSRTPGKAVSSGNSSKAVRYTFFMNSSNLTIGTPHDSSSGYSEKNTGGIFMNKVYAPSSIASNDIKTIGFGAIPSANTNYSTIFDPFSTIGANIPMYIVFDTPITKTSDESLTLNFDAYYTLTRA